MIREDRELLVELARLNREMAAFGMRMMEGSVSAAEQQKYAERLIAAGERLRRRADGLGEVVVEGELVVDGLVALPGHTAEPFWVRGQQS